MCFTTPTVPDPQRTFAVLPGLISPTAASPGRMTHMRFALISLHTSPLSQPGVGDAGGLNVYVNQVARQLVAHGHEVVIFTRATAGEDEVTVLPGLTVVHIPAGPADLPKADLPAITTAFAFRIMQWLVARRFTVDVFYSHYWLSGQAAYLLMEPYAGQSRGHRPLWIHTAHTLAAAKNAAALQAGDPTFPTEPESRIVGEAELVARVDLLVANTEQERADLIKYCHADPERIVVASPGIDETVFHPAPTAKLNPPLIAYVGRLQSFKGPQVLLRAAAQLTHPFQLVLCGGSSGNSREEYQALARELGIEDRVRFQDPLAPKQLAELYRKATLLVVPSYNETFGLVAMEAQACGTPVVAAKVGGLPYTVRDRITGLLVENHEPATFAAAITELLTHPELTKRLGAQAAAWGAEHTWTRTVETLLQNCGIFLNSTQWHS